MFMYPKYVEFDYLQGEALVMGYDIMGYKFDCKFSLQFMIPDKNLYFVFLIMSLKQLMFKFYWETVRGTDCGK